MRNDHNNTEEFSIGNESVEVKDREVGEQSSSVKRKILYVVLIVIGFFFAYKFFDSRVEVAEVAPTEAEEKVIHAGPVDISKNKKPDVVTPSEDSDPILLPPKIDDLPKLPPIPIPVPPKVQQPPVIPGLPPIVNPYQPPAAKKDKIPSLELPSRTSGGSYGKFDRTTPMLVVSGSGGASSAPKPGFSMTDPARILDPNNLTSLRKSFQEGDKGPLENQPIARTQNQRVVTHMGDLRYVIAEGKMIDVILETAINTALNTKIRALVSHDVYSEAGDKILIPKGSRLIGTYGTSVNLSQSRVDVTWTRILMPSGLDINLDRYKGVDQLGRAGSYGTVHSKLGNFLSTTIVLAAARMGTAVLVDKILKNNAIYYETKKGKDADSGDDEVTKKRGSAGAQIAVEAVRDASKRIETQIQSVIDTLPVITINQGTRLKVFVNQDIVFPVAAFREYDVLN